MNPTRRAIFLEANRQAQLRSFKHFVRAAWPIVEPHTAFVPNWHIDAICDHLERVTRGELHRLVINIPPRCMKSLLVTVMWPCWEWLQRPGHRYLCASYSDSLSTLHSLYRRTILTSQWYGGLSANAFTIASDRNRQDEVGNTQLGTMVALGVGGSVTGRGGNRIIIDDPLDPKRAHSDAERDSAERWFRQTMSTRLDDPKTGAVVIVMQRLHERDTTALALEMGYQHLCLPMEYEGEQRSTTGFTDPRTQAGELLWPQRFPRHVTEERKQSLGSYGYAGQEQQRPAPLEGGIVKREWFRYHDGQIPEGVRFGFVDLAASLRQAADYTVISSWCGTNDGRLFLIDLHRERIGGERLAASMHAARQRHHLSVIWIEKVGISLALIRQAVAQGLPAKEYEPKGDKKARLLAASPLFEQGRVWFPRNAAWLSDYEAELLSFPSAAHDDMVDVTSGAAIVFMDVLHRRPVVGLGGASTAMPDVQQKRASDVRQFAEARNGIQRRQPSPDSRAKTRTW